MQEALTCQLCHRQAHIANCKVTCFGCGELGHSRRDSPITCYSCGKRGHLRRQYRLVQGNAKAGGSYSESTCSREGVLIRYGYVDDQTLKVLLDCGRSVTLISDSAVGSRCREPLRNIWNYRLWEAIR